MELSDGYVPLPRPLANWNTGDADYPSLNSTASATRVLGIRLLTRHLDSEVKENTAYPYKNVVQVLTMFRKSLARVLSMIELELETIRERNTLVSFLILGVCLLAGITGNERHRRLDCPSLFSRSLLIWAAKLLLHHSENRTPVSASTAI